MWRRLLVLVSACLVGVASFLGASHAVGPSVDFPANVSASELDPVVLGEPARIAIQELLGEETAAEFGIVSSSYDAVRLVSQTEAGPLYAVPGTDGVCMVLAEAASCGPLDGDTVVAVFAPEPSGERLVGGGVYVDGITSVSVRSELEPEPVPAELVEGGFEVPEELDVDAQAGVEVEAG